MFNPKFTDWPIIHRRLLAIVILTPVIVAILTWLIAAPQWKLYQQALDDCRSNEKKIQRLEWPADNDMLEKHMAACNDMLKGTAEQPGLTQLAKNAISHATSTFLPQISAAYPAGSPQESIQSFVETASRIDYKFIANQLDQDIRQYNCRLPAQITTIEENGNKTPIYQMILHLWTLQKTFALALAQNLTIACQPNSDECAAMLLPSQSYRLKAKSKEAYLLEFPVKVTVRGSLDNFLLFAASLQTEDCFLPMTQLSVICRPPTAEVTLGQDVTVEEQEFTFVCTSFFVPQKTGTDKSAPAPTAPLTTKP